METKILTIMFTDIKGFTAKTSDSSRDEMNRMMAEHERLLTPAFRHFNGRVIKTIGDAFLVVFESPTDGVLCGMTVQEVLRQYNQTAKAEDRIDVRVAINLGEVELKDGDVLGEPVNIAARLEGIAEAGEVYFTEAVSLAMNRSEIPSTEVGERTFKGIPYQVRVYRVASDANSDQARRLRGGVRVTKDSVSLEGLRSRGSRPISKLVVGAAGAAGVAALLAAGVALLAVNSPQRRAIKEADRSVLRGEPLAALFILDQALKSDPLDPALREKAVAVAQAQIAGLRKEDKAEEALDWTQRQMRERPYLEALKKELPSLEAGALASRMVRGDLREYPGWDQVRELVHRYPKDPEVPYLLARSLEKKFVPQLWLYERSMELGAHRGDPAVFEACVKVFSGSLPKEAKEAHALARKYFDSKRLEWAGATLQSGSGYALLNAWAILDEAGDARTKDPAYKRKAAAAAKNLPS